MRSHIPMLKHALLTLVCMSAPTGCLNVTDYILGPDVLVYEQQHRAQLRSLLLEVSTLKGRAYDELLTERPTDAIDADFVRHLYRWHRPERNPGVLQDVVAKYNAYGKLPEDGTPWLVSVHPLVLAYGPKMRLAPATQREMHHANLLYPLVTPQRLDLPIDRIIVFGKEAWKVGRSAGDDRDRFVKVPRRLIELPQPMTLRQVMDRPPWLEGAGKETGWR